jgi:phospholipid/cholesterol/gamma-HCH transport system substrate-binding protein
MMMKSRTISNIKLGVFVLSGLIFLVLLLYMIGKNSNLFGHTYELKVRFRNIQGLVVGNNVRYAGIETGTVKKIEILNDTVIEVTMVIKDEMKTIIRKNALASIGTEGLVGNKVINISPAKQPLEFAEENDLLTAHISVNTDEMFLTLDKTNREISEIAAEVKKTVQQINNSTVLWSMLMDKSIAVHVNASVSNMHEAAYAANTMTHRLDSIVSGIKNGEGSVGALLVDTSFAYTVRQILENMQMVSDEADALVQTLDQVTEDIRSDIQEGNGPIHSLLQDSLVFLDVHASLDNIRRGTEAFNQNMEALKHNFLFRGYFKKQARQARKED